MVLGTGSLRSATLPIRNGFVKYIIAQSDRLLSTKRNPSDERVAIVVHAFYPDVFDEILDRIEKLPKRHKMFVSTTPDNESEIQAKLDRTGREYVLKVYPNRGRDVLPFMKLYDAILTEGFTTLIKVHTKKSLHRDDGNIWRQELYDALLGNDFVESALATLTGSPDIGMIGPEGHFVSMSTYIGANETGIVSMGRRLGLADDEIYGQGFIAGTMFVARTSALNPLMALSIPDDEFESEAGQIDGTLAHAVERTFALSVKASGMRIALSKKSGIGEQTQIHPTDEYAFV